MQCIISIRYFCPPLPLFIPLPSTTMNFNCGPSSLVDKHRETKTGSLLIRIFSAEVKQGYGLPLLQLLLLYLESSLWYLAPFSRVLCFLLICVFTFTKRCSSWVLYYLSRFIGSYEDTILSGGAGLGLSEECLRRFAGEKSIRARGQTEYVCLRAVRMARYQTSCLPALEITLLMRN